MSKPTDLEGISRHVIRLSWGNKCGFESHSRKDSHDVRVYLRPTRCFQKECALCSQNMQTI